MIDDDTISHLLTLIEQANRARFPSFAPSGGIGMARIGAYQAPFQTEADARLMLAMLPHAESLVREVQWLRRQNQGLEMALAGVTREAARSDVVKALASFDDHMKELQR